MNKKLIEPSKDGKYQKRGSQRNQGDCVRVILISLGVTALMLIIAILIYKNSVS